MSIVEKINNYTSYAEQSISGDDEITCEMLCAMLEFCVFFNYEVENFVNTVFFREILQKNRFLDVMCKYEEIRNIVAKYWRAYEYQFWLGHPGDKSIEFYEMARRMYKDYPEIIECLKCNLHFRYRFMMHEKHTQRHNDKIYCDFFLPWIYLVDKYINTICNRSCYIKEYRLNIYYDRNFYIPIFKLQKEYRPLE